MVQLNADVMIDLSAAAASDIAGLVRSGSVTAKVVVECFLERIERGRHLNACSLIDRKRALRRAAEIDRAIASGRGVGRIAGVPFLVKDNIEVAGQPCAAGTPALKDEIATRTAPAVAAMIAEDAILLGRTNMHELALGITTANAFSGIAHNPYDQARIPGGSSGGASAALAARLTPLALGTDTGASVRAPAAFCGVSSLRPSVGNGFAERRYSLRAVVPLSPTRDTIGPMARNLADVALMDAIITGAAEPPAIDLAKLRLGVPRRFLWENLDHELSDICEAALRRIEYTGVTLVDVNIEALSRFDTNDSIALTLFELPPSLRSYLAERGSAVRYEQLVAEVASSDVRALLAAADAVSPGEYRHALEATLLPLRRDYREYFADNDLDGCIFPTTPIPAPSIEDTESGRVEINGIEQPGGPNAMFATVIRNLDANSLAGIPSVCFPVGMTKTGLPVGLEIDGPVGSDRLLLAIGSAIETLLGAIPPPEEAGI